MPAGSAGSGAIMLFGPRTLTARGSRRRRSSRADDRGSARGRAPWLPERAAPSAAAAPGCRSRRASAAAAARVGSRARPASFAARGCRRRRRRPMPSAEMRRSISTNRPDSGRFDQSELAVTWNRMIWPSPSLRSVTSGVPSCSRAHTCTSGPSMRRIGEHLTVDRDFRRHRRAGKEARVLDRRQLLRCRPGQRAAERAAADAQRHGQQIVAAVLEARPGKAHEHAALASPIPRRASQPRPKACRCRPA